MQAEIGAMPAQAKEPRRRPDTSGSWGGGLDQTIPRSLSRKQPRDGLFLD